MTRIRNDRTSRQGRRGGATLVLAAASGGLLAAALAGSPVAHADNPYVDILNDVQNSITIGAANYSDAATDFATAGGTDEGLVDSFVGFDNTFVSSADYVLLGLTAAGTGTDFSLAGNAFEFSDPLFPLTAAAEQAEVSAYLSIASSEFTTASMALSDGHYFIAMDDLLIGGYYDVAAGQAETLAALFGAGI